MPDQKLDNLLNLAMDATPQERAKSENLNVGYDSTTRLWDVIVKYSEPERGLGGDGIQVVPLLGGYAVVTLPETELDAYSDREQVEFIEKPKRLYFETFEGREASCILPVQAELNGLTGEGILVGIVDSGVDYFHPDFRNEDGSVMRINNSVRVKEAKSAHEPLYKFAPKCKPAEQYKNLAVRVMQIVEGK